MGWSISGYSFIWAPKAGRSTVDIPLLLMEWLVLAVVTPCRVFFSVALCEMRASNAQKAAGLLSL